MTVASDKSDSGNNEPENRFAAVILTLIVGFYEIFPLYI